jgi:hypothetical protein
MLKGTSFLGFGHISIVKFTGPPPQLMLVLGIDIIKPVLRIADRNQLTSPLLKLPAELREKVSSKS